MFWGTLADRWGRRPIFLACMLVLCLACVGLALTPTDAYWLLMVLRCVQGAGSASTIALGAGVIGDITTRAERGGFFGLYGVGIMVRDSSFPASTLIVNVYLARALYWPSDWRRSCGGPGMAVSNFLSHKIHRHIFVELT